MMKRYMRTLLALLLCGALLVSNLGFAEELAPAQEFAPEAVIEEASEPVSEPGPEPEAEPEPAPEPEAEPAPDAAPEAEAPSEEEGCAHQWSEGEQPYCVLCGESEYCDHPDAHAVVNHICVTGSGTDNGDGTHSAIYTNSQYQHCDACGASWAHVDTDEIVAVDAEPHLWSAAEDGGMVCAICGARMAAEPAVEAAEEAAPEAVETIEAAEEPALLWDVAMDAAYEAESVPTADELADPETCKHSSAYETGDERWQTDFDDERNTTNDKDGEHSVYGWTMKLMHCDECGSEYEVKAQEESKVKTGEHEWEREDDGETRCWICGLTLDCAHENAHPVDDNFQWNTDWDSDEIETNGVDDEHSVPGTWEYEMHCDDCGMDFHFTEHGVRTGEHEWISEYGVTKCWICGLMLDCNHRNTSSEIPDTRYWETDWGKKGETDEFKTDNGDGKHKVPGWWVYDMRCTKCGKEYNVREYTTREDKHEWDEDDGGKTCWICGKENDCSHDETDAVEDRGDPWFEENEGENVVKQGDRDSEHGPNSEGHFVKGKIKQWVKCKTCGAVFIQEREGDAYDLRDHDYERQEDGSTKCKQCGYTTACKHPLAQQVEDIWRNPNDEENPPEDIGNGQHKVWGADITAWYCPTCDTSWGAEWNTEDEYYIVEDHQWGDALDENGHLHCWICDSENGCDHDDEDRLELRERWKVADKEKLSQDADSDYKVDAKTHNVAARVYARYYCDNCGGEFVREEDETRIIGNHQWEADADGNLVCSICEKENECKGSHSFGGSSTSDERRVEGSEEQLAAETAGHYPDNEHSYKYKKLEVKVCETCGYVQETEQGSEQTGYEPHQWVSEGDGLSCRLCGYENTCNHEDSVEIVNDWYDVDGIFFQNASGHKIKGTHNMEKECSECGARWVDSEEGTFLAPHEWDEWDGYRCEVCGWENGCDHPEEDREYREWIELDEDTAFQKGYDSAVISADGKTHTAFLMRVSEEYCSKCDTSFRHEEQPLNEDEAPTPQNHEWDLGDDGFGAPERCRICDYINKCKHSSAKQNKDENGEDNWTFRPLSAEELEEKGLENTVDDDEGNHKIYVYRWDEMRCEECGATFLKACDGTTKDDHDIQDGVFCLEGPHQWDSEDNSAHCWVCGFENPCKHPESYREYNDWWEEDFDVDEGLRESMKRIDANTHTMYIRHVGQWHCRYCGGDWGWTLLEGEAIDRSYLAINEEHEFEYDEDADKIHCRICGYAPSDDNYNDEEGDDNFGHKHDRNSKECTWMEHLDWEDELQLKEGFDSNNIEKKDGDTHTIPSGKYTLREHWRCNICEVDFWVENKSPKGDYVQDHQWEPIEDDEESGKYCVICGARQLCEHPEAMCETFIVEEQDRDMANDGFISSGRAGHTFYVKGYRVTHCNQCDLDIASEELNGGKSYAKFSNHEWDEDDEARHCSVCGWENDCDHNNRDVEDEWDEPYEYDADHPENVIETRGQEDRHVVRGNRMRRMRCEDCGATWMECDENVDMEGDHDWVKSGEDYVCRYCNFKSLCPHEHTETNTFFDVDYERGGITGVNQKGHTGYAVEVTMERCLDCGVELRYEPNEENKEENYLFEHNWNYDEGGAICDVCGWKNTCKHEHTEMLGEWYDIYRMYGQDDSRHDCHGDHVTSFRCEDCGAEFEERETECDFNGDHEWRFYWDYRWDEEQHKHIKTPVVACRVCDYIRDDNNSGCEHSGNYSVIHINTWIEPDEVKPNIQNLGEGKHSFNAVLVKEYECDICGCVVKVEEEKISDPITESHQWDEDEDYSVCRICGAPNECEEHEKLLVDSWIAMPSDNVSIVRKDFAGHTFLAYKFDQYICKNCGCDMGVESSKTTQTRTVAHYYDENGVCSICGWKSNCPHQWEETEEVYAIGQWILRNESGHYGYGERLQYELCKLCGATRNFAVVESGVEIGTKDEPQQHNWDYVTGDYCADCGYRGSTCKHENKSPFDSREDSPEDENLNGTWVIPGKATSMTHTTVDYYYIGEQCDSCDARFNLEYQLDEPVTEYHGWDWNDDDEQVCNVCGIHQSDVSALVTSIAFAAGSTLNMGVGETYAPTFNTKPAGKVVPEITLKSNKASVVKIEKGALVAKGTGTAKITATCGSKTATLTVTVAKATSKIALNKTSLKLAAGKSATLTATLTPKNSSQINWVSNRPEIATVSASGKVVGVEPGEAVVTATTANGKTAACTIVVQQTPNAGNSYIELSTLHMGVGEKATAKISYGDDVNPIKPTSFKSENRKVLTIDSQGNITAKGAGRTWVTAWFDDECIGSQEIEVYLAPTALKILNPISTMGIGEIWNVSVQVSRKDGKDCGGNVDFKSSNKNVITVNDDGMLTAKAKGTATITASFANKVKTTMKVSVKGNIAKKITLNKSAISLGQAYMDRRGRMFAETATLKATLKDANNKTAYCNIYWTSDNDDVATVDQSGNVTSGFDCGVATISAWANSDTDDGNLVALCRVEVNDMPDANENMNFIVDKTVMGVGETTKAVVSFDDGVDHSHSFASNAPSVVSIDAKGNVKAKKAGTATISVTTYNGETMQHKITVRKAPAKVTLSAKTKTLGAGESFVLKATLPANSYSTLTATSNNKKAKVEPGEEDGEFVVTGVSAGTAKITIKSAANKKSAVCTVTVKAGSPTGIKLSKDEIVLGEGQKSKKLTATLTPTGTTGTVTWTTTDPEVATVSNGVVTAGRTGEAWIGAVVYNAKTPEDPLVAFCRVEVRDGPDTDNTRLELKNGGNTVRVGRTAATVLYNDSLDVDAKTLIEPKSYESSKTSVAKVDPSTGVITGVKAGHARIGVEMYNGVMIWLDIDVVK